MDPKNTQASQQQSAEDIEFQQRLAKAMYKTTYKDIGTKTTKSNIFL
jgi:hypothetical protein